MCLHACMCVYMVSGVCLMRVSTFLVCMSVCACVRSCTCMSHVYHNGECCLSLMCCVSSSQVLLYLGIVTKKAGRNVSETAFSGGPLGELVQWSDLIATLHLLGHEMEFSTEVEDLQEWVGLREGCGGRGVCGTGMCCVGQEDVWEGGRVCM